MRPMSLDEDARLLEDWRLDVPMSCVHSLRTRWALGSRGVRAISLGYRLSQLFVAMVAHRT